MFQPYRIVRKLDSKQKRIIENGHDKVSTWGIGRELSKEDWFALSDALIHAGLIEKTGDYNVLIITENGKRTLTSRAKIELPVDLIGQSGVNQAEFKNSGIDFKKDGIAHKKSEYKRGEFLRNLSAEDAGLYEAIKDWRRHAAEEENVPPYVSLTLYSEIEQSKTSSSKSRARYVNCSTYSVSAK